MAGGELVLAKRISERDMRFFARVPTTKTIGARPRGKSLQSTEDERARLKSVGGITSSTPLRVVDLNHIGMFYDDEAATLDFYTNTLGLTFTDVIPKIRALFLRMNSEHHTVSLFDRARKTEHDDLIMQHSAWELATFGDVSFAISWLKENGVEPELVCRRMPGSNYTVYFLDPEWNRIELEFRMEAVGWDGRAKPFELWESTMIYDDFPKRIQSLERETRQLHDRFGFFPEEKFKWTIDDVAMPRVTRPIDYDASGEIGERPFKMSKLSYYVIRCRDLASMVRFYARIMGLRVLAKNSRSVAMSAPGGGYPDLVLESTEKNEGHGRRMGIVCFEMRNYLELYDSIGYLRGKGVRPDFVGRSGVLGTDDQYCVDFRDPSGDPIRLSFSPKIHGLREKGRVPKKALPKLLVCE